MKCRLIGLILLVNAVLAKQLSMLSIDAGGQHGTTHIAQIDAIEKMTYELARESNCIPERKEKKVSVAEIYDFIAGTQVGAIAASMLTLQDDKGQPKYYASDVRDFLNKNNSKLFLVKDLSAFIEFVIFFLSIVITGGLFFGISICIFKKQKEDKFMKDTWQKLAVIQKQAENELQKNSGQKMKDGMSNKFLKVIAEEHNYEIDNSDNLKALIAEFQQTEEEQKKFDHPICNRHLFLTTLGVILGILIAMYAVEPAVRVKSVYANDPNLNTAILAEVIPKDAQFKAVGGRAQPLLTAYDFDYNRPLVFSPGSKDLKLTRTVKGVEKMMLKEPMSVLQATTAAICDPFLTSPLMIKSTTEGTATETSIISGKMHASPPSFVGMAYVFQLPYIDRKYKTAKEFLMTEIQFNYDRADEKEAPTSILQWTSQLSSILYTNKSMASNYFMKQLYNLFPTNLLRIETPYGDLEMSGVKNWDSFLDIHTTLHLQLQGQKEFAKKMPLIKQMIKRLILDQSELTKYSCPN